MQKKQTKKETIEKFNKFLSKDRTEQAKLWEFFRENHVTALSVKFFSGMGIDEIYVLASDNALQKVAQHAKKLEARNKELEETNHELYLYKQRQGHNKFPNNLTICQMLGIIIALTTTAIAVACVLESA